MCDYRVEEFETIKNSRQYNYYRLFINDKCQFDDFIVEIESNAIYKKQYLNLLAIMEFISDQHKLTDKKFRSIRGLGRNDVYEFKSKDLRIYVIKKSPDMYIILGGYKANQDNDIKLLKERFKTIQI